MNVLAEMAAKLNKPLKVAILIQTFIIRHCNPSVRIVDLASLATYIVCVNFYT